MHIKLSYGGRPFPEPEWGFRRVMEVTMSFNSLPFLFVFFPIFLVLYYLVPRTLQNVVLVIGSLIFYWIGTSAYPWMILLLAGEILFTWLCGLGLAGEKKKTPLLVFSIAVLFGCLALFKYDTLLGLDLAFPLAISFYTFQMAAYLFDVHRGKICPERSLITYSAGVLLFVKLLSGPLASWESVFAQLKKRRYSWDSINDGLREFILGLSLKVLLADTIGGIWSQVTNIGFEAISTPMAWLGLVAYSLQLYFDFYGYSKMAIGLGRMLGFELPDNFLHPYASKSMSEFWRRWHVTLGAWFRDYVYIPLGGSRCSRARTLFNLFVVWLFTGIWHGSTVNYLLWGMFLFLLIASEKLWTGRFLSEAYVFPHVYMFFAIVFSWMLFAIPSLTDIGTYLGRLFALNSGLLSSSVDFLPQLTKSWPFLLIGLVLCVPQPAKLWEKVRRTLPADLLMLILFWLCVYRMSVGLNDPFMYFSF